MGYRENKKMLSERIKMANEILDEMREDGYGDLSIIQTALKKFENITGTSTDRFTLKRGALSNEKTIQAIMTLNKFLSSKWTTSQGRQEILEKRINAFTMPAESGGQHNLTKQQTLKLFDVFASKTYHKLKAKYDLDSDQIIDIVRNRGNVSATDLIKAMQNASKSKNFAYQSRLQIEKSIKNIEKRNKK